MAFLLASAAVGETGVLNLEAVKEFVAAQNHAWQARDFARFYSTFDPRATVVTISRGQHGETVRSSHTLAEDRRQAERFFAARKANVTETDHIQRIEIGPDRRSAVVSIQERTTLVKAGRHKTLYALTRQKLVLRNGKLLSLWLIEDDR